MDRGIFGPPNLPLPTPLQIEVICVEKIHFQQHLIANFGIDFTTFVMNSPRPTILPVVTYGEVWHTTIFILF